MDSKIHVVAMDCWRGRINQRETKLNSEMYKKVKNFVEIAETQPYVFLEKSN